MTDEVKKEKDTVRQTDRQCVS